MCRKKSAKRGRPNFQTEFSSNFTFLFFLHFIEDIKQQQQTWLYQPPGPSCYSSFIVDVTIICAARPSCAKTKDKKKVKKDRRRILKQCSEQGRWILMFQTHWLDSQNLHMNWQLATEMIERNQKQYPHASWWYGCYLCHCCWCSVGKRKTTQLAFDAADVVETVQGNLYNQFLAMHVIFAD